LPYSRLHWQPLGLDDVLSNRNGHTARDHADSSA
jgi:hypothetical protein